MSDGRNAWRKMTEEQRQAFLRWEIDLETLVCRICAEALDGPPWSPLP